MSASEKIKSVCILGGGQLGKMLLPQAQLFNLEIGIADPDANAPCAHLVPAFLQAPLTDTEAIIEFAKNYDAVTIEIEKVSTDALEQLEKMGKVVCPQAGVLRIIQDKIKQKEFYKAHGIPTANFLVVNSREQIAQSGLAYPFVNKLAKDGYDGRGVAVIKNPTDLHTKAFDAPGIIEPLVDIKTEIAVIVARTPSGQVKTYPPTEMVFDPRYNQLSHLLAPARLATAQAQQATELAAKVAHCFNVVGLLAVEMFMTYSGQLLVNEVAPRPHNSGHHTIDANATSQYQQLIRALLNLPLGDTRTLTPAALVNLVGAPNQTGPAVYKGIPQALAVPGTSVFLYGKPQTRPGRKMGHFVITDPDINALQAKVDSIKKCAQVTTN